MAAFQSLRREFHHLPIVCLQTMLGITVAVMMKALSTWKGHIRKVLQLFTGKGNGQTSFGILQSKAGSQHSHPGLEVRAEADTMSGNMEMPRGLLVHLPQAPQPPIVPPAPLVPDIQTLNIACFIPTPQPVGQMNRGVLACRDARHPGALTSQWGYTHFWVPRCQSRWSWYDQRTADAMEST